ERDRKRNNATGHGPRWDRRAANNWHLRGRASRAALTGNMRIKEYGQHRALCDQQGDAGKPSRQANYGKSVVTGCYSLKFHIFSVGSLRDVTIDVPPQHVERSVAPLDLGIVEISQVVSCAQSLLGSLPLAVHFQAADHLSASLAGPAEIALHFGDCLFQRKADF